MKRGSLLDLLENRRLLSAVTSLDWNGHTVRAQAGEWILELSPRSGLVRGKAAHGQLKSLAKALDARRSGARVQEYLVLSG